MAGSQGYEDELKRWEDFLKKSPRHFLRVMDTGNLVNIEKETSGSGKTFFYWPDIHKSHGSVVKWMDKVIEDNNMSQAKIMFRKKSGGNGSIRVPGMEDKNFVFTNRLQYLKDNRKIPMETSTPASPQTKVQDPVNGTPTPNGYGMPSQPAAAPFAPFQPPQYQQQQPPGGLGGAAMYGMGGAAAAAQAAGLGMYEFTELKKNAERAAEYKEELSERKKRISELEIENLDLKTKVGNAEQAKELAVLQATLNKRGFMDSEGIQKIVEMAPAVLQAIASGKAGGGQAPGLNAPSNLSPAKQELVGYITGFAEVTDKMTMMLQQVLMMLLADGSKINELTQLINETKNGNGNG